MPTSPAPSGSFFPSSRAVINGGSFTINNNRSTHVHTREKSGYDRLAAAAAPNALHDSGHVVDPPKCHPGTRVAIIQTIVDWISGTDERNCDKSITWVTGAAGAGKSAIGRSICERCAKEGSLLASFFFGANDPTRNSSKSLVSTISYQICALSPHIRRLVSEFIDFDPLIFSRSLRAQFTSLVMDPLLAGYANSPQGAPKLIVIDGLDECVDLAMQRDILNTLHYVVTTSRIPIRILVLSRPESNISSTFSGVQINSTLFKIFLGDEYSAGDDIRHYLCDKFTELHERHTFKDSIPPHWPTEDQIRKLVSKASGQFIYATTVVEYVQSPRYRPHQRLDAVLGLRPPFKDLPFSELDALYTHLINSTDDPLLSGDILAFLVLYNFMLPPHIDKYLNLEDGTSEVVLSDLTALVRMKTYQQTPKCCAFILHKSLGDFLFDSHRSKTLAKNREETLVGHLVQIMEWFSEGYHGIQFPYHFRFSLNPLYHFYPTISSSDLFASTYAAFINAVRKFPMDLYCKNLFQHPHWEGVENAFLHKFFEIVLALEKHGHLPAGFYHNNSLTFWNLALFELFNRYSNDWEVNYMFAMRQLQGSSRVFTGSNGLDNTFYSVQFHDTFSIPLSDEQKLLVISKAAVHCLTFLCNASLTNKEAHRHLQLNWINAKKRRTRPWKWHRRTSSRVLENQLVLLPRGLHIEIIRYAKLFNWVEFNIFPYQSIKDWTKWKLWIEIPQRQSWGQYMTMLEQLPKILPLVARFPLLVDLCRTKCFAPMSMMFPQLSRQARQAIDTYLDRVGVGLDDDVGAAVDA